MAHLEIALFSRRTRSGGVLSFAAKAAAVARQRAALRRLDDAALSDLGISRAEAQAEAARPFWDVPATWRD